MHFETSFLENLVIKFAKRMTSSLLLIPPFGLSKTLRHFSNDNGSIRGCKQTKNTHMIEFIWHVAKILMNLHD